MTKTRTGRARQKMSLGFTLAAGAIYLITAGNDPDSAIMMVAEATEVPPVALVEQSSSSALISNASPLVSPSDDGTMDPIPVKLLSGSKAIAGCSDPDNVYDMGDALSAFRSGSITRERVAEISAERNCLPLPSGSTGAAIGHEQSASLFVILHTVEGFPKYDPDAEPVTLWIDSMYLRHNPSGAHMTPVWRELRGIN